MAGTAGSSGMAGTAGSSGAAGSSGMAGSAGTSGAGGAAGAGGTGGAAGSSGAGGSAGSGGSGGGGGVLGEDEIKCGSATCSIPGGEICCVNGPNMSCQTGSPSCGTDVRCDGAEDCPGQVCCGNEGVIGYSEFACVGSCPSSDTLIRCTGPHNCPSSDVCCGTVENALSIFASYRETECRSTCPKTGGSTERFILCASTGDCMGGDTCQGSTLLPANITVCR